MMERLKNWLKERFSAGDAPPAPDFRRIVARSVGSVKPRGHKPADASDNDESTLRGDIEDVGPGKNALIRNRYVREETGTHETLKIIDDSLIDSGEETGIDPYNTGGFDRSKNWNNRFRK